MLANSFVCRLAGGLAGQTRNVSATDCKRANPHDASTADFCKSISGESLYFNTLFINPTDFIVSQGMVCAVPLSVPAFHFCPAGHNRFPFLSNPRVLTPQTAHSTSGDWDNNTGWGAAVNQSYLWSGLILSGDQNPADCDFML